MAKNNIKLFFSSFLTNEIQEGGVYVKDFFVIV